MKKYILLIATTAFLTACSSTNTITEKTYDVDGNLIGETITENVVTDMSAIMNGDPDDLTVAVGYFNTFQIGVTSWGGISSTEVELIRVKVPMDMENYNEDYVNDVLDKISDIIEKTKTTVTATSEGVSMNTSTTDNTASTSADTYTFDVLSSVKEKRKEKNKD